MTLSSPPGYPIEWIVYARHLSPLRDVDDATFVRAATWFQARDLGMAATGLGPDEIVVKDWPLDGFGPTELGAKREQLTAELKAATEKPRASKGLDKLLDIPVIRTKADAEKLFGKGSHWVPKVDGFLRRGRASGPVVAVKVK